MKRLIMILCLLSATLFGATIEVATEGDLQAMHNNPSSNFVLTADITCTTNFADYMVDEYNATFEWDGYTISDFYCSNGVGIAAMIIDTANVGDAVIQNGIVTNATLIGITAGMFGEVRNKTISNMVVHAYVDAGADYGGIMATQWGTADCYDSDVYGTVTNASAAGGFAADFTAAATEAGTIFARCTSYANLYGSDDVGGIAGQAVSGTFTDCNYRNGTISGVCAAGFVANGSDATFLNCGVYDATINGSLYQSGFGKLSSGIYSNCTVQSSAFLGAGEAGGFTAAGNLTELYQYCSVVSNAIIGNSAGGFAYDIISNGVRIYQCWVDAGTVDGYSANMDYLAGFIAKAGDIFTMSNCWSTAVIGSLNGHDDFCGGLIGRSNDSNSKIYNSYFAGELHADDRSGGLVGYFAGSLYNCVVATTNLDFSGATVGLLIGDKSTTSQTNCAVSTNGLAYPDVGDDAGDVAEYHEADPIAFYDSSHAVYSTWDFATPIWYEWDDRLPRFTEQPADATATWRRRYMIR